MDARSLLRAKKAERGTVPSTKSRKRQAESLDAGSEKKRRSEVGAGASAEEPEGDLPSDFFDGGANNTAHDEGEDAGEERADQDTSDKVDIAVTDQPQEHPQQPEHPQRSIEDELMAFDNEISQLDTQQDQQQQPAYNPQVYANATISAEPVLNTQAMNEGLPDSAAASGRGQKVVSEEQRRMNEEERLRRIQAYENEDYALRLEEEARAQEEADARVSALKARMEEIKARRRK